ncbi:MAG: ATP-dependent DNA helicase [bacterium]|nr:ATP-dependent DNA helicase [bacterium]
MKPPPIPSPEQKVVIDYGLRPLRVTAGAGTGKTFTLVRRMTALIEREGIPPEEVLGVTFTNKAAEELATRIRTVSRPTSRQPNGIDMEVDVFTYHGFSARLLDTYGVLVGMDRNARIITPIATRQILNQCVLSSSFHLVDITHTPTVVRKLIELSRELSDNLCQPRDLLETEPENEVEARRAELATALVAFEQKKQQLGVRDFDDLTLLAVKLVKNPDFRGVVDRIRSQYRCVLLDEYQDTNPPQRELFTTLFGDGRPVTAVGDPDQCIYEWRGASPFNFEYFPAGFREADRTKSHTLRLSINRRSGQKILDLANRIRAKITGNNPADDLRALDNNPSGLIQACWFDTARDEAEEIARELRRRRETGLDWSEMAILFRRNADIELVRLALEEHRVPYQVADLGGLLRVPEVVEIHAWLRLLDNPEDNPALLRILTGWRFRLGLGDVAPLARWADSQTRRSEEGLVFLLMEAFEHLESLEVEPPIRDRLEGFRNLYRTLLVEAQGAGPSELTRLVLARTEAWREIETMPYPHNLSARLNMHRFLDFTESWQPLEGSSSLRGFLEHLKMMRDEPVDGLDTARIAEDEAVTLSTVHRAKGLEWEAVFIPALHQGNFPARLRAFRDPAVTDSAVPSHLRIDPEFRANLNPKLPSEERQDWIRARHRDQEWRLAYVAITRAKTHLYLSGAFWHRTPEPVKKPAQPGPLLEAARDLKDTISPYWADEPAKRPDTIRFSAPQTGPDPLFGTTWEEALHEVLADPQWAAEKAVRLGINDLYDQEVDEFQQLLLSLDDRPEPPTRPTEARPISVTGLVTYADCPKRYFWAEVDRLPRYPGPSARRGTELHRRIELHNRGKVPLDDLEPDLYDRAPDEDATGDDRAAEDPPPAQGWAAFSESSYAERKPIYVEAPFELSVSESARIRGRIDAIYQDKDGGWEIVDFKSGRRSERPSRLVQLQAYALAAHRGGLGAPAPDNLRASFVYLGGGLDVVGQSVDEAWLEQADQSIRDLVDGIRSESFEPIPSDACRSCDFLSFCEAGQSYLESP